jgi:hypothetical protein
VDWIHLDQDRYQRYQQLDLVNAVMNFQVS